MTSEQAREEKKGRGELSSARMRGRWRKLQWLSCCLKLACDRNGEKLFVNLDCFCH